TAGTTPEEPGQPGLKEITAEAQKLRNRVEGERFPRYAAAMSAAAEAWSHGDMVGLRQALVAQRQEGLARLRQDPNGDLRGFEWYHLAQLASPERRTLEGHLSPITGLGLAPDGKTLASASGDGTIKLWRVANGQLRTTLRGHAGQVHAVAFSGDGKKLAS